MNRLIEKIVFSGLVIACRLAICPTSRSPSLVNATIEGVVRAPSWLTTTVGCPASITATAELVVPRSIPITFPGMRVLGSRFGCYPVGPQYEPAGLWLPQKLRLLERLKQDRACLTVQLCQGARLLERKLELRHLEKDAA